MATVVTASPADILGETPPLSPEPEPFVPSQNSHSLTVSMRESRFASLQFHSSTQLLESFFASQSLSLRSDIVKTLIARYSDPSSSPSDRIPILVQFFAKSVFFTFESQTFDLLIQISSSLLKDQNERLELLQSVLSIWNQKSKSLLDPRTRFVFAVFFRFFSSHSFSFSMIELACSLGASGSIPDLFFQVFVHSFSSLFPSQFSSVFSNFSTIPSLLIFLILLIFLHSFNFLMVFVSSKNGSFKIS